LPLLEAEAKITEGEHWSEARAWMSVLLWVMAAAKKGGEEESKAKKREKRAQASPS